MLIEAVSCLLLAAGMLSWLLDGDPAPELDLGRRAWVAARFGMVQAEALGPLFRHLGHATRQGLRRIHRLQERIRCERQQRASTGALAVLASPWRRRHARRSAELAELRHLVEQLEQMGGALARYRAGTGRLMELQVPMQCLQGRRGRRRRRA